MSLPRLENTVAKSTNAKDPSSARQSRAIAEPEPSDPKEPASPGSRESMHYDGGTCLKLYLSEIGKVKLLKPEEEVELALRIQKGDKKAREDMIKANLRLVVKIARDYDNLGLPLMDLISEGNIGLMKAVERFDPTKGAKLSTYSSWWIKQSIKRALANQSKTIRLPVHMVDKISKMKRVSSHLYELLGREPSDEEVAEGLGIHPSRVAEMRAAAIRPISLDAPIGDEESNNLGEIVEDENAENPCERFQGEAVTRMLQEMIASLTPREAQILRARFGLDGLPPRHLEEVGQLFGVTRERVRQIQNKALLKLRAMIEKLERPASEGGQVEQLQAFCKSLKDRSAPTPESKPDDASI